MTALRSITGRVTGLTTRIVVAAVVVAAMMSILHVGGVEDAGAETARVAQVGSSGDAATATVVASSDRSSTGTGASSVAIRSVGYSAYGCVGLLNAKQWMVMAFALGYCPSVWILQMTPWGRSVVNWIVSGLCKQPWIVRAATGGRYSTC